MATATAAAAAAAIPAEVETEALTLLHRCRGDRAESDLVGRIERLSRRIETIAGLYRDGSRTLRRFIAEVYPQIRGRRAAEERLHRLRKLAEPKAPRRGPTAPPSEELRRLAVEAGGERAIADIRAAVAATAAGVRTRLEEVGRRIDSKMAAHGQQAQTSAVGVEFLQDDFLADLRALLAERRELRGRLAALEQAESQGREVQASRVRQAIDAGGGPAAAARGIRESRLLDDAHLQADAEYPRLEELRREQAALEGSVRRLGGADAAAAADSHAGRLEARRAELAGEADGLRAAIDARRTAAAAALVTAACEGDEPARAGVLAAAAAHPECFAPGLADQIMESQYEYTQMGALLVGVLTGSEGE